MPVFWYFFGYRYKMLCLMIMSIHCNFYPCHLLITLALCTSNLKCCNWSIRVGKSMTSFNELSIVKLAWLFSFCAFSVVSLVYTQVIHNLRYILPSFQVTVNVLNPWSAPCESAWYCDISKQLLSSTTFFSLHKNFFTEAFPLP